MKAPPKSSASLFSSFIGGSRPSFITNERTSSATVLKAPVGPAAADLQVHRSNQSAVLLQGNVDLLFARPQAASQGSGGSFSYGNATGHRLAGQAGSRLQQQSGMDGKVNMSSAPSAANNLNSVAYGAGSESMRSGGASGNWVSTWASPCSTGLMEHTQTLPTACWSLSAAWVVSCADMCSTARAMCINRHECFADNSNLAHTVTGPCCICRRELSRTDSCLKATLLVCWALITGYV